jgi:riboflavin synthase
MFTGLVEQTSRIIKININPNGSAQLKIVSPRDFDLALGDSVSVNGCCLTVTNSSQDFMDFDLSQETLARTSLGQLQANQLVNLERAMQLGDRLGGHMVSGHIDCCGLVSEIQRNPSGWVLKVEFPKEFASLVITKGSITIQGISLTINSVQDFKDKCEVSVMLIPLTIQKTNLSEAVLGQVVNLEFDLIGKYVQRSQSTHGADRP